MGGGGLTESIACIQGNEVWYYTAYINLDEPEEDFDFVAGVCRKQKVDIAMTTAFGFGGQNAGLVFRKYEG